MDAEHAAEYLTAEEFANDAHHEDEELEPEDPAQPNVSELMARLSLW